MEYVSFADLKSKAVFLTHKAEWGNCTACPLCKSRKQVVFFRGRIPCDLLFIGEAPGESEDSRGYPFVGEAGKYFDKLLQSAFLAAGPRDEFKLPRLHYQPTYGITNIVACIPLAPDTEEFEGRTVKLGSGTIRPPNRQEAAACQPRLEQIVRIAQPKQIVCLGDIAVRYWAKLKIQLPMHKLLHPANILREESPGIQAQKEKRWLLTMADILKGINNGARTQNTR